MIEPIVITGAGVISAIGNNKQETLASLRTGKTGVGRLRYLQTAHKEFPVGEVKLSNEEMKQMLSITQEPTTRTSLMGMVAMREALDEAEATPVFSALYAQFVRTKVVPELDAYRLGAYATKAGTTVAAALSTGKAAIDAVATAKTKIKDAEANLATCYLFITPALKDMIDNLDTTASRAALNGWAGVIEVPSARFFKTIALQAGSFKGTTALNFLAVDKQAVIQFQKHTVNKIITPDQNQDADAWKFGYRTAGIAEVQDNKVAGIYAHTAASA